MEQKNGLILIDCGHLGIVIDEIFNVLVSGGTANCLEELVEKFRHFLVILDGVFEEFGSTGLEVEFAGVGTDKSFSLHS